MLAQATAPTWQIVVMGVSGCGKSTVAARIAQRMHLDMIDGDDLHLPQSVDKMRAGIALQDMDRWPWLDRIGQCLSAPAPSTDGRVVACSALKRAYRDRIRQQAQQVCFVFLDGSPQVIRERMARRVGHYMPTELLDSQFNTLERPGADEADVLSLNIDIGIDDLTEQAVHALQARKIALTP